MMTEEGSTKIINSMTPGVGVNSDARAWSFSEHAIFLLLLSTLGHVSDKLSTKQ